MPIKATMNNSGVELDVKFPALMQNLGTPDLVILFRNCYSGTILSRPSSFSLGLGDYYNLNDTMLKPPTCLDATKWRPYAGSLTLQNIN